MDAGGAGVLVNSGAAIAVGRLVAGKVEATLAASVGLIGAHALINRIQINGTVLRNILGL